VKELISAHQRATEVNQAMRNLCRLILLVGLALPLSLNTAYAGQHTPADSFADITPHCSYGHDPIISKIENQAGYAEITSTLEKSLKPNENILCFFSIDNYGRIKNLRVCSEKSPTAVEKKILALIAKASPFPYPTKQEMIDRGVQVEFWKDNRILSAARIAPAPKPYANVKDSNERDPFKDLQKSHAY
jgi:hypothetical protein